MTFNDLYFVMIINSKKTRINYNNSLKNRSENKLIFRVQKDLQSIKKWLYNYGILKQIIGVYKYE